MTNPNNPGECCERQDAIKLANLVLDRVNADPDDDLAILARQFLREVERSSAPKDTQSTECVCRFFSEPHYHAQDNPLKVSYDWWCKIHGQQHREWNIKGYEGAEEKKQLDNGMNTILENQASRNNAPVFVPPPTGAQEGWAEKLREFLLSPSYFENQHWKRQMFRDACVREITNFIREAITAAYERGRKSLEDEYSHGSIIILAGKHHYMHMGMVALQKKEAVAAHHKKVVEEMTRIAELYRKADFGLDDEILRHLLSALITIDPEKKNT